MEQIILDTVPKRMKDKKVIGNSQCGFIKGKSCLINLIAFYNKMIGLTSERRAVDIVYLDFIQASTFRHVDFKAFDIVSLNFLIGELMKYRLDKWTVTWTE